MKTRRNKIKVLAVIGTTGLILMGFGSPSGLDPVFGRVGGAPRFSLTRSIAPRMSAPRSTRPTITASRVPSPTMAARNAKISRTGFARSVAPRQAIARTNSQTANRTKLAARGTPAPTRSTTGFKSSKTPAGAVSRPSPAAVSSLASSSHNLTGITAQKPTGFSRVSSTLTSPGKTHTAGTIASRPAVGTSSPGISGFTKVTAGSVNPGISRAGINTATRWQLQPAGTATSKPAAIPAAAPKRSNITGTIAARPTGSGVSALTARAGGQTRIAAAIPASSQPVTHSKGNVVGTKAVFPYTPPSGKQASVSQSVASGTTRPSLTRDQAATVAGDRSRDKWERADALGTIWHGPYGGTSSGSKTATSAKGNVASTKPTAQSQPTSVASTPSTSQTVRRGSLHGEDHHHRRPHGLDAWRRAEREASVDRLSRLFGGGASDVYPRWGSPITWYDTEGRPLYDTQYPTPWPTDIDARAVQRAAASDAVETRIPTESSVVDGGPSPTSGPANPADPGLISQLDRIRGQLTHEAQQDLPDPKDMLQGLNLPPDLQQDLMKAVQDRETRDSLVKHLNQMDKAQLEEAVKFVQDTAQDPEKLKKTVQILKGDDLKKKAALAENLPPQLKRYAKEQVKKTVKETFKELLREVMPREGFNPSEGNPPVAGTRG